MTKPKGSPSSTAWAASISAVRSTSDWCRVLRDDLPCDAGGPPNGIGYAALATSRDGRTWHRFREPFLDRNLEPESWDHAMTWIGYTLPVADEVFFYYGGYARGHKVAPQTERQIGLAQMKRDRYLAIVPKGAEGRLLTRPFLLPRGRLTVNANAANGQIGVRLLDPHKQPLMLANGAAAASIRGDAFAHALPWHESLGSLPGKPVRLEFTLKNASLFGFEFHSSTS